MSTRVVRVAEAHERLLNRDFLLLWQGQLVSQVGSQAFVVAVMYWTMQATGSATLMALLMIGSTLPAIVLGPFAGAVADRHSRKAIILVGDAARGLLMLGIAWLTAANADRPQLVIGALFVASLAGGTIGAVFNPAITAAIVDVVPRARLASANSIAQLSTHGASVAGLALGGILYRQLGAPLLFLIDGVSFLISAASEAFVKLPAPAPRHEPIRIASYLADARAGSSFLWNDAGLRTLVLAATVLNFTFAPLFVLLPFFVRDNLHAGPAWYGLLLAALSAGSLSGITAAGFAPLTGPQRERLLSAAFLLLPALLIGIAATGTLTTSVVLLFSAGLLSGSINVFVITLVQLQTDVSMRGRVLSVVFALAQAAMPVAMGISGLVGDLTGLSAARILGFAGAAGLIACAMAIRSQPLRRLFATAA